MREYDEEQELMWYVWRNYPQIVRRRECLAPTERVHEALPPESRDEYWQHAIECRRLVKESCETGQRLHMDISPILPDMRPELLAAVARAYKEFEKQAFWSKFLPHKDNVSIHRCARCQRILINEKSRQCLWCGHKWHQSAG